VNGDGNGWVHCALGHRHWGRFGAAGLLVTDGPRVVLQHRAPWTHDGGTWALPGGARDSHEDVVTAALREAAEEAELDPTSVTPIDEWVDDHGGWSYTTVVARAVVELAPRAANSESIDVRWWAIEQVSALPLHAGFAAAWPRLRELLALDQVSDAEHRPGDAIR
jgi:8-oxo-dGTP diphosphatase